MPPRRDDAAVELALAIVKTACFLLAGDAGDAGSTLTELLQRRIQGRIEQRRAERFLEECADVIASKLLDMLDHEFHDLPENERIAATLAVKDTFVSGQGGLAQVITGDLDAQTLERSLHVRSLAVLRKATLNEAARAFYQRLLREACAYAVEFATTVPGFTPMALTRMLKRTSLILRTLHEVLDRLPEQRGEDDFTVDYRRLIVNRLDRMQIFGITGEESRLYPLSVAYVSLSALHWSDRQRSNRRHTVGQRVEDALAGERRVMLVGGAGSGKTTLLRWLAVRSARGDFTGQVSEWNDSIPFLLPLRQYAERPLPAPEDFLGDIGKAIAAEMPPGWVHGLLRDGRALVLVDGVDELRDGAPREAARKWLADLVNQFPKARYVVTSRTAAINKKWLRLGGFATAELQPMSRSDVRTFLRQWHIALVEELRDEPEERDRLPGDENALLLAIERDRHLRALTVSPLLCAMLCALNHQRNRNLPTDRMEVYAAALEMMLGRRDRERGVSTALQLTYTEQVVLLQDLAFWLVCNGWSDAKAARVREHLAVTKRWLPHVSADEEELLTHLLERSGLLREPAEERIDFVHKTFQEYLAGRAAAESGSIGQLIENAHDDQWRDVIIMAAGHAQPRQREELIRGLLNRSSTGRYPDRPRLIALACAQAAPQLAPELKGMVDAVVEEFIPPSDLSVVEPLVAVGKVALDVLAENPPRTEREAQATIRTVSLIGGDSAMELIGKTAEKFAGSMPEVLRAWRFFAPEQYAREVLASLAGTESLIIDDPDLLPALRYVPVLHKLRFLVPSSSPQNSVNLTPLAEIANLEELNLDCGLREVGLRPISRCAKLKCLELSLVYSINGRFGCPPRLQQLSIVKSPLLRDISPIENWNGIRDLKLRECDKLSDISVLATLTKLQTVYLDRLDVHDLSPLAELPKLRSLHLSEMQIDLTPFAGRRDLEVFISSSNAEVRGKSSLGPGSQIHMAISSGTTIFKYQ